MKQRLKKDAEEGFTLIELMVVVLILGILMAIAIPTFLSLTSSAKKTAAQADLTTAITDAATYFTTNGTYGDGVKAAVLNLQGTDGNITWVLYEPGGRPIGQPILNQAGSLSVSASVQQLSTGLRINVGGATAGAKEVLVTEPSVKGDPAGTVIDLGVLDKNGNYYWAQDASGTTTYAKARTSTAVPNPRKFTLHSLP